MKNKNLIIILIVVFITGSAIFYYSISLKQKQELKLCKRHKSGPELSPGDLYCSGIMCVSACDENSENCHKIIGKEECEKLDVISFDDKEFIIAIGKRW